MKKIVALGFMIVSTSLFFPFKCEGGAAVLQQVLNQTGSDDTHQFRTIMAAINRHGDLVTFRELVFAVGLQYPLRAYGKKKPKSKKAKAFLELIPQGQKITVLAPIGSVLLPLSNSLKLAQQRDDKTAIDAAKAKILDVLKAHIIKDVKSKANLKGMLTTIGGQQINGDNLVFYKKETTDIKAGNGILHIIKHLATHEGKARKTAKSVTTASGQADASAAGVKQSVEVNAAPASAAPTPSSGDVADVVPPAPKLDVQTPAADDAAADA
jgi:uncharacterized surface protein with fasciclin (FAS1) repeats